MSLRSFFGFFGGLPSLSQIQPSTDLADSLGQSGPIFDTAQIVDPVSSPGPSGHLHFFFLQQQIHLLELQPQRLTLAFSHKDANIFRQSVHELFQDQHVPELINGLSILSPFPYQVFQSHHQLSIGLSLSQLG